MARSNCNDQTIYTEVLSPGSSSCPLPKATSSMNTSSAQLLPPSDQAAKDAAARSKRKNKRRAARACLGCRARKVRCDVVESMPCRNCKWDGIACVIQAGRRSKLNCPTDRIVLDDASPNCATDAASGLPQSTESDALMATGWAYDEETFTPSTTTGDEDMSYGLSNISDVANDACMNDFNSSRYGPHKRQPYSLGCLLTSMVSLIRKSSLEGTEEQSPKVLQVREKIASSLPGFVKRPPADLDLETLEMLQTAGAFALPPKAAQRALLRAYIRGVHYNLPCVDVYRLARAQNSATSNAANPVSLMLYQAIMFAGSLYASEELLKGMGYASRQTAMRDLFRRAKLLYNFEYEKDPASTVQSLLIFSLRSPSSCKQQTPSSWTQLAISIIRQEKLHLEATRSNLPRPEARTWKLLWWCCIVRDTFNTLGACHTPSIRAEDCEDPVLELEDFSITAVPGTVMVGVGLPSFEEQIRLAELFIELGRLSLLVSRVLSLQYRSPQPSTSAHEKDLLSSLESWYHGLSPSCQPRSPAVIFWNDKESMVDVQRSVLQMTYHTALLTLRRQSVLPASPAEKQMPGASLAAQSANSILQLAAGLATCGLDDLMPVTGVALLLPALIVHSLDAAAYAGCYNTVQDAQQGMQVLRRMRERFEFADMAACYLQPLRQASQGPASDSSNRVHCPDRTLSTSKTDGLSLGSGSAQYSSLSSATYETNESSPLTDFSIPDPPEVQFKVPEPKVVSPSDQCEASPSSMAFQDFIANQLPDTTGFGSWSCGPADTVAESNGKTIMGESDAQDLDRVLLDYENGGIFRNMDESALKILGSG